MSIRPLAGAPALQLSGSMPGRHTRVRRRGEPRRRQRMMFRQAQQISPKVSRSGHSAVVRGLGGVLAGVLALAACAPRLEAPAPSSAGQPPAMAAGGWWREEPFPGVSVCYADAGLARRVSVGCPVLGDADGCGGAPVRVPLRGSGAVMIRVAAQLEFLDPGACFSDDRSTRRVLCLEPGITKWLCATPTRRVDHRLVVRLWRDD